MQFGLALPRNFTYAFEVFTELSELGIPAGQFVRTILFTSINHMVYLSVYIECMYGQSNFKHVRVTSNSYTPS